MPTYTAACMDCGTVTDYIRRMADSADTPVCCEKKMTKILTTTMVSAMAWSGHKGFHAPDGVNGVGTWIEDGAAFKRYMDKNNVVPASEGEQEARIQSGNKAKADERKLETAVLEAYRRTTN